MILSVAIPESALVDASWFESSDAGAVRDSVRRLSGWRLHADRLARIWGAPDASAASSIAEPWLTLCALDAEALRVRVARAFAWATGERDGEAHTLPELGRRLTSTAVETLTGHAADDAAVVFLLAAAERVGADARFCLALRFDRRLHDKVLPDCREAVSDADRRLGAMLVQALNVGYPDAGGPARRAHT